MTTTEPTTRKPLDIEKLTLGEVAMVESLSDQSISGFGDDGVPMGKMLAALAMIAQRRNGFPKYQFGDAMALTMDEAMDLIGMEVEDDTVDPAADADAVTAPRIGLDAVIAAHTYQEDADAALPPIEAGPTKTSKRKSPTTD